MKRTTKIISCMASNYNQPIADLVARLSAVQLPEFSEDRPRQSEVDYAATLIVLLVLTFEAWISRARYFDDRPIKKTEKEYVLSWIRSLNDSALEPFIERLSEIYFLRDAIVHNHIWTYTQSWVEGRAYYSNFDFDLAWQGKPKKFNAIVGKLPFKSLPRTKKLNLAAVPDFVGRKEVASVFKTVKDSLDVLEKSGHITTAPKVPYVHFGGKLSFPFWNLISQLQRSFISRSK